MRKILFKGKRIDDGEWVEGFYGELLAVDGKKTRSFILVETVSFQGRFINFYFTDIEVDPETVSQFTGLSDKNGKEIFEGDKIKCKNYHGKVEGHIDYHFSYFYLSCSSGYSDEYLFNCKDFEIIGNIHDNKELLEASK